MEPPDTRDTYTNLRLRIEQLRRLDETRFTPVEGLLLVRISTGTTLRYGDRLRIQGHLETPPENEDFSYRDYLAHQGIYSYMPATKISLLEHGQGNLIPICPV